MIRTRWGVSALLGISLMMLQPKTLPAQKITKSELTDIQKTGKRIFQQRCSVCHTQNLGSPRQYAPALYRGLVDNQEQQIADFINEGSPNRMPGFKYTLDRSQIEAIVEYLKTVDHPAENNAENNH